MIERCQGCECREIVRARLGARARPVRAREPSPPSRAARSGAAVTPRRVSPASASTAASTTPSVTLRRRVSTFPRRSSTVTPGNARRSCARRRMLDVPITAPVRSDASRSTRTSAGVQPGRDGGDDHSLVVLGRQVLGRMDRDVDLVAFERVEDRVDEEALQAGRRVAGRRPLVAGCRHRNDLGLHPVLREAAADLVRLSEGERRAACADAERHSASGSRRRSSISSFACRSSAPGSDRSFSSTIGSCRSFAATPRATASTASRSRGVRSERRPA